MWDLHKRIPSVMYIIYCITLPRESFRVTLKFHRKVHINQHYFCLHLIMAHSPKSVEYVILYFHFVTVVIADVVIEKNGDQVQKEELIVSICHQMCMIICCLMTTAVLNGFVIIVTYQIQLELGIRMPVTIRLTAWCSWSKSCSISLQGWKQS